MRTTLGETRRCAGLSMVKLGAMIGTDHSYIRRIENGTLVPSVLTALRLAKVFDVAVERLFIDDGRPMTTGRRETK